MSEKACKHCVHFDGKDFCLRRFLKEITPDMEVCEEFTAIKKPTNGNRIDRILFLSQSLHDNLRGILDIGILRCISDIYASAKEIKESGLERKNKTCMNCKWCYKTVVAQTWKYCYCHRFPPTIKDGDYCYYPRVNENTYICGEYEDVQDGQ